MVALVWGAQWVCLGLCLAPWSWEGGSLMRGEGALGTMSDSGQIREWRMIVHAKHPGWSQAGSARGVCPHRVVRDTCRLPLPFTKHLCPQERPRTATRGMWPAVPGL